VFYEKDGDTWAWSFIFTSIFICITIGLGIHIWQIDKMDKMYWNAISGIVLLICFYFFYRYKKNEANTTYIYVDDK